MRRVGAFHAVGAADAVALVLVEPLSFWGGVDVETGAIIDRSHPDLGKTVTGRVLVMPSGRGSSSSASVLAEMIRRQLGPAGIVLARADSILTVACLVAQTLYGVRCPIVVCPIEGIRSGDRVQISSAPDGGAWVDTSRSVLHAFTPHVDL
jgi:predicted aconitase with swiveling domain